MKRTWHGPPPLNMCELWFVTKPVPRRKSSAYMRCCQQCSQCRAVNQAWVYHTLGDLCPRTRK